MTAVEELNDRQRRFCELVVQGLPAGRAYESAGYTATGAAADVGASKTLAKPRVAAYLKSLRGEAIERASITRMDIVNFLADVIRTPVGQVDENSILCQEWHYQTDSGGARGRLKRGDAPSGNETELPPVDTVKVKMVGKMDAVKQICLMMGWNAPVEVDGRIHFVIEKSW